MCRIFCHSCTVLIKEGGGARLTGSIHPALRRRKLEVGWVWEKAQTAGTFWSRRSDSEQPFSLEGRRLISLTAWGRAWGGGGLARYMGPWCINLCSWRGPHLVLWLILASWLPSSLQSTQWVGSGDRQAGRQHGGGSRQRERQLRPRTESVPRHSKPGSRCGGPQGTSLELLPPSLPCYLINAICCVCTFSQRN